MRAQLAHREAQLEHVRSERDTPFVQEEELLAHMHLLSSEAKDWKSRAVSEATQALCKESAEAAHRTRELQEAMDKQFQARWRQAEAELWDMCVSPTALKRRHLQPVCERVNWNTSSYILPMRDACSWIRCPSKPPTRLRSTHSPQRLRK